MSLRCQTSFIIIILFTFSSLQNRFYVIDKRTGEVHKTKYYADKPFFFFHYANAYEDDDHIVMDIDAYPDERVLDLMNMSFIRNGMFDGDPSQLIRFALPLGNTNNVKVQKIRMTELIK